MPSCVEDLVVILNSNNIYGTQCSAIFKHAWNIRRTRKFCIILVISVISYSLYTHNFQLVRRYFQTKITFWRTAEPPCHIPVLNPNDPSIQEYITDDELQKLDCGYDHARYFTTDTDWNLIQLRDPLDHGYLGCCYRRFHRKSGREFDIEFATTCIRIKSNITKIPKHFEFIIVKCLTSHLDEASYTVLDLFGFVPLKPVANNKDFVEPKDRRRVNVVILGLDAVSHMNFMRSFNSSHEYLTKNLSAIGMFGHTKHGDNTFPNMLGVLSGLTETELKKKNWDAQKVFDNTPLIWKNFSKEGYRTAFSEDALHVGMFVHEKKGFHDPPTDYYHPILLYQMDKLIGHTAQGGVAKMCAGPRLSFEVLMDMMKKMAVSMNKQHRYFHLTWATALTHDKLNNGKHGDKLLLETLQWFKSEGYLEDTVLILMSDHGIRGGDIRSTLQGKIEERMPFLYFTFPDWFKDKYEYAVKNLVENTHLLTTHFDLHETLMDLLHLPKLDSYSLWKRQFQLEYGEMPRGISLFLPIPRKRTCEDAGISSHWCVCRDPIPVVLEGHEVVVEGARQAVHTINNMLRNFHQCLTLVFDTVLNAQVYRITDANFMDESEIIRKLDDPRLSKQPVRYNLAFSVQPSGGTFEATVTRFADGFWEVSEDISRTNSYGLQSRCIHDYNLKKFCYCG